MLARKFDIDDEKLAFDAEKATLWISVHPAVPEYDEAALLIYGWGIFAGCAGLQRIIVTVETPSGEARPSDVLRST